jgi:hypothetical protein
MRKHRVRKVITRNNPIGYKPNEFNITIQSKILRYKIYRSSHFSTFTFLNNVNPSINHVSLEVEVFLSTLSRRLLIKIVGWTIDSNTTIESLGGVQGSIRTGSKATTQNSWTPRFKSKFQDNEFMSLLTHKMFSLHF